MVIKESLEMYGVRLRSVVLDDAPFIVAQRRAPRARRYLGETSSSLRAQRLWIAGQRARNNDFYFLIESASGSQLGTIGLYEVEPKRAEWGRFLVRAGSKAAPAALLTCLTYAFERLGLDHVYSTVLKDNMRARAFYAWVGLMPYPALDRQLEVAGEPREQVGHILLRSKWQASADTLRAAAQRHAERVAQEHYAVRRQPRWQQVSADGAATGPQRASSGL